MVSTADLVSNVYRKATGEIDPAVTVDSEDGSTILSVINECIDSYYNALDENGARIIWNRNIEFRRYLGSTDGVNCDVPVDWRSVMALGAGFYSNVTLEPTNVGTPALKASLVPLTELTDLRHEDPGYRCSQGRSGLIFYPVPMPARVYMDCLVRGAHLDGTEEDVEAASGVHNVYWLMLAAAAEYVRTDIVRGGQYSNVLAQANDAYRVMLEDNAARTQAIAYDWLDHDKAP